MKPHRQECLCHSIAALMLLAGCAQPPRVERATADPTTEPAYAQAVQQLAALNRQAEDLLKSGRSDAAADAITRGQPIQARLLAAPRPTLAAMEAASDLDDLYARMLLANHRDGWARMTYEKNVTRWRIWKPQTDDTKRRFRQAQAGVAECDRRIMGK
jgi:hypothetical protein